MIYRHILGTGTMSKGWDEPFSGHTSLLENLPIKDYTDPRASRRFGRLTKLIYIAAHRALLDAKVEDFTAIPTAVATWIGESKAALGILEQIHQTKGVTISPALVPNSVHNAAAGYLSIGLKNQSPSLTVSQGRLSAEAALAAASDMLGLSLSDRVLVVQGDEADPEWIERLVALKDTDTAGRLHAEALEEGAAAFVLGTCPTMDNPRGLVASTVERWDGTSFGMQRLLSGRGFALSPSVEIRVRKSGFGEMLRPILADALHKNEEQIIVDGDGPGTVQCGPCLPLIAAASGDRSTDLLLVAMEADDLAVVHWKRSS
jgi:hypothetical protein